MASAKLEILISAKETASKTMDGVKAAFQARAMEIQSISQSLVKNGEKVEKFLHGISLLKMATETESFKVALAGVSPTLQKTTSDLLNMGVAIGGTLSLAKDLVHVLPAIGMKGVGALAVTAGLYVGGKSLIDQMNADSEKTIGRANTSGPKLYDFYKRQSDAVDIYELNRVEMDAREATTRAVIEGNFGLAESLRKLVRNIFEHSEQILEANRLARANRVQEMRARQQSEAMDQIKAMQRAAFEATPQGRLERIKSLSSEIDMNRASLSGITPEQDAPEWLRLTNRVKTLSEELDGLKSAAGQSKISDLINSIREGAQNLLRPRRSGTTTTSLGTLPGSPILADALSRQGLFSGGGRSNPLTGLAEQKLTSIDSTAKQQVEVLRGIWRSITTGNLGGLAP